MTEILQQRQDALRIDEEFRNVRERADETRADLSQKLETVVNTTDSIQSRVHSCQSVGQQILAFVASFPSEIRESLRKISQTDIQIYDTLLQVQQDIAAAPTNVLQSNIRFEDALGRGRDLPYEYFRHWEVNTVIPVA